MQKLESFIFDKMSATRLPGLSIALVKDGEVVYSRGLGLADIARGKPVTPQTLFGAASITKSFAAISILQLAEKGLLSLTDPVDRFLPSPIRTKHGEIRIEHLLTHTSGMPALGYIEAVLRHAHHIGGCNLSIGNGRDVLTFAQGSEDWAETAPGRRWFYLNEGYVLLGEIIERISGKPYGQYIREQIFQPLGMSRSYFAEAEVTCDGDVATPYILPRDGSPPRAGRYLFNVLGADAALITNVLDLARYLAMFLKQGRGVLSSDSFASMIKPRIPGPMDSALNLWGDGIKSPRPTQFGYGVTLTEDFLGDTLIGHSGSLIVATSHIAFLPKHNLAVAVLTNGNGYPMPQLAKVALAIMLGHEPRDLPFVRTEELLTALAGQYESYRGTVKLKVLREGDFLRLDFVGGDQPPAPVILVPESLEGSEPRFFTYSEGQRMPVTFRRAEDRIELIYERYKLKRVAP